MPPIEGAEILERWHEFYLLAGTAAVTLVGLLFVALSFNLDVLIHESREHLLRHARATMMSFIYLLVVSLVFLIPDSNARRLGATVAMASLVFLGIQVRFSFLSRGAGTARHDRSLARRGWMLVVIYALAALNAIAMLVTASPYLAYNMIALICAMLGNSAGTSWDLLVEVGRLKAAPTSPPDRT